MTTVSNVAGSVLDNEKFEALSESEKEQKFLSMIDKIKMSQDFQNFEHWRNKQGMRKKMQYYKDGEMISVKGSINYATKAPGTLDASLNPLKKPRVRGVPNPVLKHINPKKNIEDSVETSIYEQVPRLMRVGVSFGLLKKPWTLSEKKLLENIKTDANTLDKNLGIFREVCKYVPQLMALGLLVEKLLPYAKRYNEHGAALMQEKIKKGKKKQTEKSTTYSLSNMEQNIIKSEIISKNVNQNVKEDRLIDKNTDKDNDGSLVEGNTVAINPSGGLSEKAG